MILLYFTAPTFKEAEKISRALLDKKLVACANISESFSFYDWIGKSVKAKEFIVFAKTSSRKAKLAEKLVKKMHSYEIPCILSWNVKANSGYEKWVEKQVR